MSAAPQQTKTSILRKPLLYTSLLIGFAALYTGEVFFSRWRQNRELEEQAAAKKRAEDRREVELLGGNQFEILNFYAEPATIRPGEPANLCYGVSNAKTVRLEPQGSPVWPSSLRCVQVAPKKSTEYTLTIEDGKGNTRTATVTLQVR